jgi:tagaturonate reductase
VTARVLQFGTSRFLQAHADLFIDEARAAGQDIGPITVVKSTPGAERAGRVQAFADPAGFPVHVRGRAAGQVVDRMIRVHSVTRGLDAHADWPTLRQVFAAQTEIVISNTGEAGYALTAADRQRPVPLDVPAGFPAKLLSLLAHRFEQGASPLLILPCELVSENGKVLRRVLDGLAADWGLTPAFTDWLRDRVTICDTLVDRIVSAALEPLGAVAEPYGLWAIEVAPGVALPFSHPNVTYTDDLTPFLRLKLHILNLGHTWLAQNWATTGRPADETVRQILADPPVREGLLRLYRSEVVPGFAAQGMGPAAGDYVTETVERFDNLFLDHRLSDIAQNHALKIERRVQAFQAWVRDADPALAMPMLDALVKGGLALQARR